MKTARHRCYSLYELTIYEIFGKDEDVPRFTFLPSSIDSQIKFRGPVYFQLPPCEAHNTWPLWV
jgi:hypothetical protein